MAKIQGQFDVSLSAPIDVVPDFPISSFEPCRFRIEGDMVIIQPLKMTDVIIYPEGDYVPPKLTEIRVWISREIDLGQEKEESLTLSHSEERRFEEVLIEASQRFVTIIRQKTNQWDLDTRHPVYAYNYTYSRADVPIKTVFPLEQGAKRLPEYAVGTILLHSGDAHDELSQEMWQEVVAEVPRSTSVALHDELLYDAKTFRSQMRYDASVLYAAIASELMIEEACSGLLRGKGLSDRQSQSIVSKLRNPERLEMIHELDPSIPVKDKELRKLFELRSKIAHGRVKTVAPQEANEALSTAEQLKRNLAGISSSPP